MATLTHAELMDLWVLRGGLQQDADVAAAIAQAESGGCQYAHAGPTDDRPVKQCTYRYTTGENSYGLWQINRNAHPQYSAASLYTPGGNAAAAVAIAGLPANFDPWSTYTNGAYEQFVQAPQGPFPGPESGGPPGAAGVARTSDHAWTTLNHRVAHDLPSALKEAARVRTATLRRLR